MQFLLAFVKHIECVIFKVDKEDFFHFVGDLIEEPSDVLMAVIIVEDPSQSFINSQQEVMKVIVIMSVVKIQLFSNLGQESFIREQVVH